MRYCTKCKRLFKTENDICPVCRKKTIDDPSHFSPVRIAAANGFELERIRSSLDQAGIPCSYNESAKDAVLQILNSAPPENCDIYVPLSAYSDAVDILVGIGAFKEEDIPDENEQLLQNAKKQAREEELPPKKAAAVRFLSAIAFLAIIAAAVWLTDIVFELVKALFTG